MPTGLVASIYDEEYGTMFLCCTICGAALIADVSQVADEIDELALEHELDHRAGCFVSWDDFKAMN